MNPSNAFDFDSGHVVVDVEHALPRRIASLSGLSGRVDEVGEQDRDETPFGGRNDDIAGEEPGDLGEDVINLVAEDEPVPFAEVGEESAGNLRRSSPEELCGYETPGGDPCDHQRRRRHERIDERWVGQDRPRQTLGVAWSERPGITRKSRGVAQTEGTFDGLQENLGRFGEGVGAGSWGGQGGERDADEPFRPRKIVREDGDSRTMPDVQGGLGVRLRCGGGEDVA